jgi:copper chaperone
MVVLKVPDMSCGGCASSVRAAVQSVDPAASVQPDLAKRQVRIESKAATVALCAALRKAGFPAVPADAV